MPGHTGSPYWAAVDFDSEGEEHHTSPSNHRMYLDPWDNDAYGMIVDPVPPENMNSFAGEPVSASFYYVPTKNYESEDEVSIRPNVISPMEMIAPAPDYSVYGSNRRRSQAMMRDVHSDIIYVDGPIRMY